MLVSDVPAYVHARARVRIFVGPSASQVTDELQDSEIIVILTRGEPGSLQKPRLSTDTL